MSESEAPESFRLRIRREAGGLLGRLRALYERARESSYGQRFEQRWQASKWFRLGGYALAAVAVMNVLLWVTVTRNLPSADSLLTYQPQLPTMVRGVNGEIVYSYARERRVQLRFVDFPKPLINAYLSAEDKTFWSHGGIDYTGLAGAVLDYVSKLGSGARAKGGSTITQQVAKNILIGNEYSITRKLKEMVLARRIETVLTKQQILELYLNEIPLGRQSFGVQAASQAYFGKDVDKLTLAESAFLATLPQAPEKYGRARHSAEALERRNWVLGQMVKNDAVSQAQADAARALPLALIPRRSENWDSAMGYFVEDVRRELIAKYGETAEDGPNSIYSGGLWVRTSLDPQFQRATRDALRAGLIRYVNSAGSGWFGPIDHYQLDPDAWQSQLVTLNLSIDYQNWRIGMVIERDGPRARIGFADGTSGPLVGVPERLAEGDVVAAAPSGTSAWTLRSVPKISGGMVVQDPASGRVLAMQGGFDAGLGSFNRASQAERQPGSTIKPFVYATGLDFGMSPASEVVDGKFCVYQGSQLGEKCFRNFDMRGAGGTHTMRWGLEQSRNLMTVRIASDTGMDHVVRQIDRVGIGKYPAYLSFALGAGDTTVLKLSNAYAALANNGVQFTPTLVDFIQDRTGKVIWRADTRRCTGCAQAEWNGKSMPRFTLRGKQVIDPRTAYQVVHMLEGVVTRGTAVVLRDLELPLFGKTGTTTGPTNVWFAGGSPNLVSVVYLGYDQPKNLGSFAQGGTLAAPIFKQLVLSTRTRWDGKPFIAPRDIHMVRIDRISGKRVLDGSPANDPKSGIIWEAFKAESEAKRGLSTAELAAQRQALMTALRRGAMVRTQGPQPAAAASVGPAPGPSIAADAVVGTQ